VQESRLADRRFAEPSIDPLEERTHEVDGAHVVLRTAVMEELSGLGADERVDDKRAFAGSLVDDVGELLQGTNVGEDAKARVLVRELEQRRLDELRAGLTGRVGNHVITRFTRKATLSRGRGAGGRSRGALLSIANRRGCRQ